MKKTTKTDEAANKKKPAQASRRKAAPKMKDGATLLEREHKVVFKDGNSVLKIFDENYKVSAILNEAMNEARAAETGLPVAKLLEVCVIKGKWAIRREYIPGETLADVMAKDKKNLMKYVRELVGIQNEIFTKTAPRMGSLTDKLDAMISASPLDRNTRYDLHMKLQSLPRGKSLCHGDFNPTNVLITPSGEWRVIDWSHVRLGDPLADVARTYLLFWLSGHVNAAEKYMTLMCETRKVAKSDIQKWLPIVAAAEASKPNTQKNLDLLLHWASVVDYE